MSAPRTAQVDRADAQRRASRAYDAAIREAALTNDVVGASTGVAATRVRAYRSDDDADIRTVASLADLILVDEAVVGPLLARLLAERLAVHGPPKVATLEQSLCDALAADAEFQAASMGALRDGCVTPVEAPAVETALARSDTAREKVRGQLRARSVR